MTPVNLGVCFGPSLLRPEFETVSSIYDIKFRNAIVELLIIHHGKMFQDKLEQHHIDEMVGATDNDQPVGGNLSNSLSSLTVRELDEWEMDLFFFSSSRLSDEQHQRRVK